MSSHDFQKTWIKLQTRQQHDEMLRISDNDTLPETFIPMFKFASSASPGSERFYLSFNPIGFCCFIIESRITTF
ncbi:hypothetical protein SLW70_12430 [Flavobacterium sp. NG2]|uniref:hypothetical protein n=1 Tax=Flavobacterium sp. NG2 TaxID=3097547 RepID=UPI002A81A4FE|nr:hypothetical protein [Flavobacterium sp. NG2]WPR70733.1 hypothetical protein SLW70_12430 [Flavobacterium sp. NG2]